MLPERHGDEAAAIGSLKKQTERERCVGKSSGFTRLPMHISIRISISICADVLLLCSFTHAQDLAASRNTNKQLVRFRVYDYDRGQSDDTLGGFQILLSTFMDRPSEWIKESYELEDLGDSSVQTVGGSVAFEAQFIPAPQAYEDSASLDIKT